MNTPDFSHWRFLQALQDGELSDVDLAVRILDYRYPAGPMIRDRAVMRARVSRPNKLGVPPGTEVDIKLDRYRRMDSPDAVWHQNSNLPSLFRGVNLYRAMRAGDELRLQNCVALESDPDEAGRPMFLTTGFNIRELPTLYPQNIRRPLWCWEEGCLTLYAPLSDEGIDKALPWRIRKGEDDLWHIEHKPKAALDFMSVDFGWIRTGRKTAHDALRLMHSAATHRAEVRRYIDRASHAYDLFTRRPAPRDESEIAEGVFWTPPGPDNEIRFRFDEELNRFVRTRIVSPTGLYEGWEAASRAIIGLHDLTHRRFLATPVVSPHEVGMALSYLAVADPVLFQQGIEIPGGFSSVLPIHPRTIDRSSGLPGLLPIYPDDVAGHEPPAPSPM